MVYFMLNAGVAELVDATDLGSVGATCGGSSPSARTTLPPFHSRVPEQPRHLGAGRGTVEHQEPNGATAPRAQ